MRASEADWLRQRLLAIGPDAASPLLNVGSSTEHFRTVVKPHIETRLFAPLRAAGFRIIHIDMKSGAGVDVVCRIDAADSVERLRATGAKAVLCSNMLEHVDDPAQVADACVALIGRGGHLLVTVPHAYPYHPDPIDTMFRPDVAELAALFDGCALVESKQISDGTVLADERAKGGLSLALFPLRTVWLLFSGLWRPGIAAARWQRLRWLNRQLEVSCCHLVKQAD